MEDNIFLGDRNGVRTPMQWTSDRNGGFSRADPQRLYLPPIQDPIYGYEALERAEDLAVHLASTESSERVGEMQHDSKQLGESPTGSRGPVG